MIGRGAALAPTAAERLYARLMADARGEGNDHALACIYASWLTGVGVLPAWLGLEPADFHAMIGYHFSPACARLPGPGAYPRAIAEQGRARAPERGGEVDDLVRLMLRDRAGASPSEAWMARLVAAGCLGGDHLWQDLGLWCRADLSALMERNFPALAARNARDMKWKRFLYRELCEVEGVRLCRAPTCQECRDYDACFGPET